jgi:undecaprenyl-diphosphatase
MLALWPGTSRSMSCIVGGQLAELARAAAADFAFLLALPTLGAATLYELLKHGRELSSAIGIGPLVVGLVVSFGVGWLVIAAFVRYLRRFGMWPFALYRIALGALILSLR